MKDRIFKEPLSKVADFEFDEKVAAVFDDMLDRSIPFYGEVQRMIIDFVGHYYQDHTTIYDLGCSTGIMMARILQKYPQISHICGIDNSAPMIAKAKERLDDMESDATVDLLDTDLRMTQLSNASIIIMNYTLQFIRPLQRNKIVADIYDALTPGGVFLLSEKVLEESTQISRLFIDMYYRFKRRQGYSEMEIAQKRERLENVLIPYKVSELREMLQEAGFRQVEIFFKWQNFTSIIAIKDL